MNELFIKRFRAVKINYETQLKVKLYRLKFRNIALPYWQRYIHIYLEHSINFRILKAYVNTFLNKSQPVINYDNRKDKSSRIRNTEPISYTRLSPFRTVPLSRSYRKRVNITGISQSHEPELKIELKSRRLAQMLIPIHTHLFFFFFALIAYIYIYLHP